MSTSTLRVAPAATDVVTASRRVGAAIAAALQADRPARLLVAGPRGSGKSAVLGRVTRALSATGRTTRWVDADTDVEAIPVDVVAVVDDLEGLATAQAAAIGRRAADATASLVVSMRSGPRADRLGEIRATMDLTAPTLVLGQITRGDVLDLGDDAPGAPCLDWILHATGGITWWVSEALAAHDERDCATDPTHRHLERLLAQIAAHVLAGADDEVRHAVERACDPTAAPEASDGAARAHAEGLLLRDGGAVPVIRAAVDPTARSRGPLDRGEAAFAAGDIDAAAHFADSALADDPDGRAAALAAACWSARGMLDVARRQLSAGPGAGSPGARIAAFGCGVLAERSSDPDTTSLAGMAADLLDEGLRATLVAGRAEVAVATLARASRLYTAARSTLPLPELPAVIAAAAAQSHGDLGAARAVIDAAIDGGQGGRGAVARLLLWRAWLAMHQVRWQEATASLGRAMAAMPRPTPRDELMAHAVRVGLARRHGDPASLAQAWEAARPALLAVDVDLYLAQPLTELVATAAKQHDSDIADSALAHVLQILSAHGDPSLWSNPLRWAGVQRGLLLNDPASLAPHAHALFALSSESEVATTLASAGRLWTTVRSGTVDADQVDAAAHALGRVGLTWDGARLAGVAAAIVTDRRVAARLLACAREIHPLDSASPKGRPVEPPAERSAAVVPAALSHRESDVARLVLEGKTYAEIGAAMFISPRTAEHHIASIRRRLGASSRSDLIARLRSALDPGRAVA